MQHKKFWMEAIKQTFDTNILKDAKLMEIFRKFKTIFINPFTPKGFPIDE